MTYRLKDSGELVNAALESGDNRFQDTLDLAHQNGVKTLLVLHNYNGGMKSELASKVIDDKAIQQKVIDRIVEEIQKSGHSGVNIDFENVYSYQRSGYASFVEKVSAEMKKHGWITVVSATPKTNDLPDLNFLDYERIGQAADFVLVMTYDEYNPFRSEPGPQYTLSNLEKILKFSTTSIPSHKVLLGIGNHHWVWNDSTTFQLSSHEIDQMIAANRAASHWDEEKQAPYATYYDPFGRPCTVYYQDARTYKLQFDIVKKYNLGGFFLFPLGWENDSYWTSMRESVPALSRGVSRNHLLP
jgi:spore germination protein